MIKLIISSFTALVFSSSLLAAPVGAQDVSISSITRPEPLKPYGDVAADPKTTLFAPPPVTSSKPLTISISRNRPEKKRILKRRKDPTHARREEKRRRTASEKKRILKRRKHPTHARRKKKRRRTASPTGKFLFGLFSN